MLRSLLSLGAAGVLAVSVAACSPNDVVDVVEQKDPISFTSNVSKKATEVPVDTIVTVSSAHGSIDSATLVSRDGDDEVPGRVADGVWTASERLEPGLTYRLKASGVGDDGVTQKFGRSFTTQALSLDEQTYPAVAPLQGETVGVGMPVIVTFDIPVKNRKLFERNMSVESTPAVKGSWNWYSDREVHYRPKKFWPAGAEVSVHLNLNSLPAGAGIYGQQDQDVDFTIGRKVITTVDVAGHHLTVNIDGKDVRTIPVSTGDARHQTRQGTKIIMEKFDAVDMDAATTGVDSEDPDYYDLEDVQWAMRVTNSGEFLHAAPWSVPSQGYANVSHGCTGMSTANAKWLYDQSRRGDVVEFINSPRVLEDRNGWTDWNVNWKTWTKNSALA